MLGNGTRPSRSHFTAKQVGHAAKADIRGPGSKTLLQEEAGNHWKVRAQHSAGAWSGDTIWEQLEAHGVVRAG